MKPPEDFDIRDRKMRVKCAQDKLSRSKICKANKSHILKYVDHRKRTDRIGLDREYKYLIYLRKMAEYLEKPYNDATKEDIEQLVDWVNNKEGCWGNGKPKELSNWGKHDYLSVLKGFFQWLKGCKEPEETSWIKRPKTEIKRLRPDEILTWDDAVELSKKAMNPRDRALPQVFWDSGVRVEELLTLKLKDVEIVMQGQAVKLHLRKSKSRIRSIMIVRSAPALLNWMEHHPLRDDKESFLWVKLNSHTPLDYETVRKALRDLRDRTNIDKPVNPHNFRKSSASFYSHHLSPQELKLRFGWTQGSKMLDIYCFPDEEKINCKILELEGLKESEPQANTELPRKCMWCQTVNPAGLEYCNICSRPLDPEKGLLSAQISAELDGDVKAILEKHPEIVETIVRQLVDMRGRG